MTNIFKAMRNDWDARAQQNPLYYIASGTSSDITTFLESGERDLREQVLPDINIDNGACALEIGCGIGRLCLPLAKRAATVTGVDISEVMVRHGRDLCKPHSNIRLAQTDGTLSMIPDVSQDLVFSYIVFQHIPSITPIATYVREAERVLRPGGIFTFQVDGRVGLARKRPPDTYEGVRLSRADIDELLSATSFTIADEWGRDTHYYWLTALKPGHNETVTLRARIVDYDEIARLQRSLPELKDEHDIRRAVVPFLAASQTQSEDAFVCSAFELLLYRSPSSYEVKYNTNLLREGLETRESWIDSVVIAREFRNRLAPYAPTGTASQARLLSSRCLQAGLAPGSTRFDDICRAINFTLSTLPPEAAVIRGYEAILGRHPDQGGLGWYAHRVASGQLSRLGLVLELIASPEFRVACD